MSRFIGRRKTRFFFSLLASFVFVATGQTHAQINRPEVIKERTGTVLAAGPAKTRVTPARDKIRVHVAKTGGRAATQINIYVDGQRQEEMEFTNGKYEQTKSVEVEGVQNKEVRVDIVNQSVGNKFKYELKITQASVAAPTSERRKSASLIHFYYGDSLTNTLGQETVRLVKAMQGYDKKVLLKHNDLPDWADWSQEDQRQATVTDLPTRENFFRYVRELTADGYFVDIYIFAHGLPERFTVSNGNHGDTGFITGQQIRDNLSGSVNGNPRAAIRSIWGTHCYGSTLNDDWQAAGAKVIAGARYVNFFPTDFRTFIREWNKGNVNFRDAVANKSATGRTLAHTYLLADARSTRNEWGGCKTPKTILGSDPCARNYFIWRWAEDDSEWQAGQNGRQNLAHSSEMRLAGDIALTKNTVPSWSGGSASAASQPQATTTSQPRRAKIKAQGTRIKPTRIQPSRGKTPAKQ